MHYLKGDFMSLEFDVVVAGAGNAGLTAAATCAKNGLKTLLLEKHNLPGGSATSFVRGRYEFETSLHELADVGSVQNPGDVRKVFTGLGADVDWILEDEAFHILCIENGLDVAMPTGVMEFAEEMERQAPGSKESVLEVFNLAKKGGKAIAYLSSGPVDPKVLATEHTDFMRMASHSVKECLDALGMPEKAQQILNTYWPYLGAPADQLDFLHYVFMLMRYIIPKPAMPSKKSHELSLSLEKVILDHGGKILYDTPLTGVIVEDGHIAGVKAKDLTIKTRHLISNVMPEMLYKTMDEKDVPKGAAQLINARTYGAAFFTMYLGLDCTKEELGIEHYSNFISRYADSRKQFEACKSLDNSGFVIVNCLNEVIEDSSPEGTCTLFFTGMYYDNPWEEVQEEDYFKIKKRIANEMIDLAEENLHISIRPHIEEIVLASPVTFARYLGTPTGTPYGYLNQPWDGMLPRIMSAKDEQFIGGLRFCGAHDQRTDGYSSTYMNGYTTALATLADIKGGK
jgi:prolycopene isomerase